jgi:hypothetical protein
MCSCVHTGPVRRANKVSNTQILELSWPADLDPETVPFATRAETVLRWKGLYDDPTLFNTLTVAEVAGWWNTGPVTIANIRMTGNAAICRHHKETEQRAQIAADLDTVASEPWALQVWHHDPRFADHLPKGGLTVHAIATTGTVTDRHYLWNHLDGLSAAVESQAALELTEAVAHHVEASQANTVNGYR